MYTITPIVSGYIMADGGAMFGAVPKRAWMRKYDCDENNLCRLAMRCLLVESDDRKILVDLGMGNKYIGEMSSYEPSDLVDIASVLLSRGIRKEDITDVILTHLHFDHCGYATSFDNEGNSKPTFTNAKYWLSSKQWTNTLNVNPLESDSIFGDDIYPISDAGQLCLIDQPVELFPDFYVDIYDGHTAGQLVPIIHTDDGIVAFPGDLIPTAAHVSLEWLSAYDLCATTSYNEKKRFLYKAVKENYTLIYCHDTDTERSFVKCMNDNYIAST